MAAATATTAITETSLLNHLSLSVSLSVSRQPLPSPPLLPDADARESQRARQRRPKGTNTAQATEQPPIFRCDPDPSFILHPCTLCTAKFTYLPLHDACRMPHAAAAAAADLSCLDNTSTLSLASQRRQRGRLVAHRPRDAAASPARRVPQRHRHLGQVRQGVRAEAVRRRRKLVRVAAAVRVDAGGAVVFADGAFSAEARGIFFASNDAARVDSFAPWVRLRRRGRGGGRWRRRRRAPGRGRYRLHRLLERGGEGRLSLGGLAPELLRLPQPLAPSRRRDGGFVSRGNTKTEAKKESRNNFLKRSTRMRLPNGWGRRGGGVERRSVLSPTTRTALVCVRFHHRTQRVTSRAQKHTDGDRTTRRPNGT